MKFLAHIDLSKNQLQNAIIHPLGTAPAGTEGQIYYNSTVGDKKLYIYDGTTWVPVGDITSVASTTSQLTVTSGTTGSVSLALDIATSVTNGGTGLVTSDLLFDYIAAGTASVTSIIAGTGISVNSATGAVTVTNTDLGSSQNIFKNIAVSGQTNVVADTNNDTLTLVGGSNVTITTDALTDTITIASLNTTYTAGTGLSLSGTTFNHSNAITASNFGDTGITRTLAFGGTFVVPYVTYDAQGHLVTKSNLTLTLPANPDTNWYPTAFAWTGGTTAGPTGSLTGVGMSAVSYPAIPSATASASGVVTTNAQTFAGDKTFSNNVIISGDLTVSGTTTTVNTETILLADNIITLNSNYTGATPTENGGIEVERGTLTNVSLIWDESIDRWKFTNDGTIFYNIPIPTEYTAYVHPTQTAITVDATNNGINVIDSVVVNTLGHVTSVTTRDLSNATTSAAGVMSAADKTKLDGIATGANLYVHPAYTTATLNGGGLSFVADITVDALGSVTAVSLDTIQAATETQSGVIELATQTEVNTGTDTVRAVTPATLATYVAAQAAADSFATTLTATAGAQTVAHGLGTSDVIVQLFDTSNGEVVYADIARSMTTPFAVTVTFITAPANPVRALVQKID